MHSQSDERDEWARHGLVPLADLSGARMADDEPDLVGWEVVAPSGARLGRVDDLLVDRRAGEVAAVLVDAGAAAGRRLMLPIDRVDVEERDRRLVARDGDALLAVHDRTPRPLAHGDRLTLADVPVPKGGASAPPATDAPPTGVTVERTADGDEIVTVPVVEERLVVERRPVVTDVLVIRKKAVRRDVEVEADLRKERIDVERHDLPEGGG